MPLNRVFLPFRNISNKIKDIGALMIDLTYIYTTEGIIFCQWNNEQFYQYNSCKLNSPQRNPNFVFFFPSHYFIIRKFCNKSPFLKSHGFLVFSQICYQSCALILVSRWKNAVFCGSQLSVTLEKAIFSGK